MLNILFCFKGTCIRHPRYNPEKDGEGGIKGGCEKCIALWRIFRAVGDAESEGRQFRESYEARPAKQSREIIAGVLLLLVLALPGYAQIEASKPTAKVTHFDTGWWARAHWTAAAFDASTTGLCIGNGDCHEQNPLAGRRPKPGILALGWAAESAGVSLIPNKKVRRIVQIGAIGAHLFFGSRNLKRWH